MSESMASIPPGTSVAAAPPATRRRRAWLQLIPALPIGVLVVFVIAGLAAPLLTPYDPVRNDLINSLLVARGTLANPIRICDHGGIIGRTVVNCGRAAMPKRLQLAAKRAA